MNAPHSRGSTRRRARLHVEGNGFEGVVATPDLEADQIAHFVLRLDVDQHSTHVVVIRRDQPNRASTIDLEHDLTTLPEHFLPAAGRNRGDLVRDLLDQPLLKVVPLHPFAPFPTLAAKPITSRRDHRRQRRLVQPLIAPPGPAPRRNDRWKIRSRRSEGERPTPPFLTYVAPTRWYPPFTQSATRRP